MSFFCLSRILFVNLSLSLSLLSLIALSTPVCVRASVAPYPLCSTNAHTQALTKAIEISHKRAEAKADDPFYPDSFKKESVPDVLASIELKREDLTGVKVLGAGQFGRVYLAVQTFGDDESKDVQRAVKLLRDGASLSDKEEFTREAEIMTVMEHPNIVQIVGTCMVYRPWLVVLEMMQYGDLKKVLLACQHKEMEVSFIELLVMAEQVAAALEYVAGKGFVHMDVAARNALLHTNNLVKLSDFGITRPVDPDTGKFRLSGQLRMAVRWMAPETLGKHPILFSEKTDVYSYGVLMWELPSYGRLPFRTLKAREAKDKIRDGLMLGPPPSTFGVVWCTHAYLAILEAGCIVSGLCLFGWLFCLSTDDWLAYVMHIF